MKLTTTKLLAGVLLLCLCGLASAAQAQEARLQINQLDRLAPRATEAVEITLNDMQMQLLRKLVSLSHSERERLQSLMTRVKGIYVRGFEFAQEGEYSEADLESIRAQLRSPGWEKIVEVRNRDRGSDEVFFLPWNNEVGAYAAISTEPRKLCVVNIIGPLGMDDLATLEKEFQLSRCGGFKRGKNSRDRR